MLPQLSIFLLNPTLHYQEHRACLRQFRGANTNGLPVIGATTCLLLNPFVESGSEPTFYARQGYALLKVIQEGVSTLFSGKLSRSRHFAEPCPVKGSTG